MAFDVAEGCTQMRMTGAVALTVIVIEVLLVVAYGVGVWWLGGWRWGVLLAGLLLLLMALPWIGDLIVRFDSSGPAVKLTLAWWGTVIIRMGATVTDVRVRVLGIPWRRGMKRETEAEEEAVESEAEEGRGEETAAAVEVSEEEEAGEAPREVAGSGVKSAWRRLDAETVEGGSRVALSAVRAASDLIWDAHEIKVLVSDVAQRERVDRVIAQVVAERALGPIEVVVREEAAPRRVRLRYRVGLLRAALGGLQVMVEGRPIAFVRRMRQMKRETAEQRDEDRELIEEILQQREDAADESV